MFIIIIVFVHVLTRSSPVASQDNYTVISQGISHGMWLVSWEFLVILQCTSFRVCIFIPAYDYVVIVIINVVSNNYV